MWSNSSLSAGAGPEIMRVEKGERRGGERGQVRAVE